MKNYLILFLLIFVYSCSKSGYTPTPTNPPVLVNEVPIAFTIDIDLGSGNIFGALGSSQNATINLSSLMPKNGIQIESVTKNEVSGTVISSSNFSSLSSINIISIDSLKPGVLCNTMIKITSKSTPSNTLAKSFKIFRK